MDKIDDGLIASTFAKVKDVDIFALKAYMEITHGAETGAQSILLDVFVNFPFFLLNLIVGLFSVILRFFENFSLYDTYKQTVYHSSQKLWENLSGNGSYTSSLLYLLVAISAFSIFISYLFSKGDFSKRLIHLFVVIILGMGYFGTIQSTSGGIYILDTVHQLAGSFSDAVTNLSLDNPSGGKTKITQKSSVADNYVMKTSYTAYLFVNTGQLNGKFHNNQTGKEEKFDNEQVLGKYDKSGKFITPKQKDILNYIDKKGDGANDGTEKNRWLSAVNDYLWIKSGYVILKIFEAVILAVPLILIQLIAFMADVLVIILMFIFPLALLVSFLPRMQDIIFNVLKVMFGAVSFPALAGFLTLIVFYTQTLIATFVKKKFTDGSLLSGSNFKGQAILFMLLITVFVQGCVFWGIWKYKETFLRLIIGSRASQVINQSADRINEKANDLGITPKSIYEKAHDMSNLAMMGAGYGIGTIMNAQDNWNAFKERRQGKSENHPSQGEDPNHYDEVNADESRVSKDDSLHQAPDYQLELPNENGQSFHPKTTDRTYDVPFEPDKMRTDDVLNDVETDNHMFNEANSNMSMREHESKTVCSEDLPNSRTRITVGVSPLNQDKIEKMKGDLNQYNSDLNVTKNHGRTPFEKGFNASKTKEVRKRHNLERQSKVLEELEKLRGAK
ncbi:TPA: hypothetical protein VBW60_001039 [Streptococcus agalactiae]|uniref:hypothetical protein n=1 Tax=Streptococcus agalactiae TaxID=1311 RepID=UPI00101130F9|nr:hypothetical protein [Streptococcus agalactiae]KAF1241552.1 hypothetical protein B8V60_08990 [Streptococcus agalactiae]MCC9959455.1 hypothetical protein [Streptococcus agalactiae]RXN51664.1 hypothetical protein C1H88_03325 [Streptococcus agalactiae]HEN0283379.1 hypothetical protein [Streptococcus agalactiae]HEN0370366.1 hypothetical protein [Streptococcus agalactiae]